MSAPHATPGAPGEDDLVHINELCPRCRTLLHMSLPREQAREAIFCPACDGALLWTGERRREAIFTLLRGSLGTGMVAMLFYMVLSVGLTLTAFMFARLSPELVSVVAFLVLMALLVGLQRLMKRFGRPMTILLNLLSGRTLVSATQRGDQWRIDAVPPPPPSRKRREDEALDGGLNLLSAESGDDQRGRLTDAALTSSADARVMLDLNASPARQDAPRDDAVMFELDAEADTNAEAEVIDQASNGHQRPS